MSQIFLWWVSLEVSFYISVINTIPTQTKMLIDPMELFILKEQV